MNLANNFLLYFTNVLFLLQVSITCAAANMISPECNSICELHHNRPISEQLLTKNTCYKINEGLELGWIEESRLSCNIRSGVERKKICVNTQQLINVQGRSLFLCSTSINLYWNEFIIVPEGCTLLSTDKKEVLSEGGFYCPGGSGRVVYVASNNKKAVTCSIGKVFYTHTQPIIINKGIGISIPADCVLLSADKKTVMSYNNVFCADNDIQCYIACLNSKEIDYKFSKVLTIPEGSTLQFQCKGMISNGIIRCQNTSIVANNNLILPNTILVGTLTNEHIPVEWFGCNTKQSGDSNQIIYERCILPTVLSAQTNVFHSQKGIYKFSGGYPIRNRFWGYDHQYIMDCKGIEVYGCGKKTIIQGLPKNDKNPADVFNLVDMKNLSVHDLTVTAVQGNGRQTYGTNAFSLIHNLENISVHDCFVYDMPYVEKDAYPDGGKAYTIQVGAGTSQNNVLISNNYAKNVAYGLDYTKTTRDTDDLIENIFFHGNKIENAIVGCVIHQWDSPEGEIVSPIEVRQNEFVNCQVGINCQTCKGATIKENKISSTTTIKQTKYYDGVYGVYLVGAYNVDIEENTINLKKCDSFVKATVYSYIPKYNGSVSGINVRNNSMRGKNTGFVVDIGSSATNTTQEGMYKDIMIENNQIQEKEGKGYSKLGRRFIH